MKENQKRDESEEILLLKARMEEVEKDLKQLCSRLDRMNPEEKVLKDPTTKMPPPKEESVESEWAPNKAAPPVKQLPRQNVSPVQPMKKKVDKQPVDYERIFLQKVLPTMFLAVFVIGLMFFLKIAADNGWLGEKVRLMLGYATSIALGFFGYRHFKADRRTLGTSMMGGMVAVGLLATFAGHYLYDILGVVVAFVISMTLVGTGMYMSHRFKSETLSLVSALGAFLVAVLLEDVSPNAWFFATFVTALFVGSFYFSLRSAHRFTHYVVFFLFQMTLTVYAVSHSDYIDHLAVVMAAGVQHLFVIYMFLTKQISMKVSKEVFLYANVVALTGWVLLLGDRTETVVYLTIALLYATMAFIMSRRKEGEVFAVFTMLAFYATGVFILSLDFEQDHIPVLLFILQGTIGLLLGFRFKGARTIVLSVILLLPTVLTAFSYSILEFLSYENLVWATVLVAAGFVYAGAFRYLPTTYGAKVSTLQGSLLGFYGLSLFYLLNLVTGLLESSVWNDETQIHILILATIALSVFYLFGYKVSFARFLPYGSLVVLGILSPFMLFLPIDGYAVTDGEAMFNLGVQMVYLLLVVGITAIAFRKALPFRFIDGEKGRKVLAFIVYIYGFILLNKFLLSGMDQYEVFSEYVYFIHSIFLMGFALSTLSFEKRLDIKGIRLFGMLLIVATIVKLIFIDLAMLSLVVRTALFLIVGLVGIVYSKTFYKKMKD